MRRRMEYRPSRPSSALGLVVGLLFVLLGLFVIIPQFGAFGLIWTLVALGITIFHAVNTFSDKGVPSGVIHIEEEQEAPAPAPPPAAATAAPSESGKSPEERLETLRRLHQQGLITAEEYDRRRREILDEM